jgi:predicted DCC family thiol-disulfide oxidoreductase YuxK
MPVVAARKTNARLPGTRARQALVLYDGRCPLCIKTAETLKLVDWLHALHFQNARDVATLPQREPPLEPDQLLQQMHLIAPDQERVYRGFRAFRWMAWRLPVLWPLAPFLYFPGVPALGQKVYLWIARNRYRLVPCQDGVCHVPPRA